MLLSLAMLLPSLLPPPPLLLLARPASPVKLIQSSILTSAWGGCNGIVL
jgi:hypothetical protein